MTVNGTWIGGYVLFEDAEVPGIRVAVCPSAVGAVMDDAECRDATLICIGGRVVKMDASMDAVAASIPFSSSYRRCSPSCWEHARAS
jgi:hypothetical protein